MNVNQKKTGTIYSLMPLLLILAVSALSYVFLIRRFGFYRDDWFLLYGGNTGGWQAFIEMWSIDRPFDGYYFGFIYSLFGNNILLYNISAVVIRILSGCGFYILLHAVWPTQRIATTFMALLFTIYPGFMQLPNALEFHPHVMGILMEILSIMLSLMALQRKSAGAKILFIAGAMLSSILAFLLMDYYIGMEGLRFSLLFYIWWRDDPQKLKSKNWKRLLAYWLPYILSAGVFLFWRVFLFKSERMVTDIGQMASSYIDSPVYALLRTASSIIIDFLEVSILSWLFPTHQLAVAVRLRDFGVALFVGVAAGAICLLAFKLSKRLGQPEGIDTETKDNKWPMAAMLIGMFAVVISLVPITFGNRSVTLSTIDDRFALPGAAGAAIFLVGFLFFSSKKLFRLWVPLFLVGVAVMGHYLNAINFSEWWQDNREVWWQLSWRAPGIADNTLLMASLANIPIEEGYSLWSPASLIYHPQDNQLYINAEVINPTTMHQLFQGMAFERDMRGIVYNWSYERMLLFSKPAHNSCLHVLDGNQIELSAADKPEIYLMAPYSRIDLIQTNALDIRPPKAIFGSEPEHTWCYYYQKASLARQKGDWQEIVRLRNEARDNGFKPNDWIEWMPFLEAAIVMEDFDDADQIIIILKSDSIVKDLACQSIIDGSKVEQESYQYLLQHL